MDDDTFRVRFWGVRGSVPVSGPQYVRYGGNTTCIQVQCGQHTLLFDAGSGIRPAGEALAGKVRSLDVFFTHSHYDHIIGLPFFLPFYSPRAKVRLWSGHLSGKMTTHQMLCEFMRPPWFPVHADICKANLDCRDFASGDLLSPHPGLIIRTGSLNHPGGCIGYRIEWQRRAMAIITDTEHEPDGALDENILALIEGVDLVIYDCTYTEEEMRRRRGFGHSTWQQGVKLCQAAGARRLALFHHDPTRTDEQMENMEKMADAAFPGSFAAREGQELDIGAV